MHEEEDDEGMGGGEAAANGAALCPACGRFIGPASTCPYCETDARRSPMLRALRYAALLLGIAGLGFLYLAVTHRDLPAIRIGDVTSGMNFAYVRVAGTVSREPYVAREKGKVTYVSFVVDDGSGDLRVQVYRDTAAALVAENRVPAKGANVEVAGSLSVTEDKGARLRLQTPRQLKVLDVSQ